MELTEQQEMELAVQEAKNKERLELMRENEQLYKMLAIWIKRSELLEEELKLSV